MAAIAKILRALTTPSTREAKSRLSRRDSGVSLHEMVVTTAILAILITSGGAAFETWFRTARSNQDRTIALQEGRMIGDRLSKEIRMATGQTATKYMASTPDSCTFNPLQAYSSTYTLVEAGPTSLAFYKVPSEGRVVRIRFSRDDANRMWMATRDMTNSNPDMAEEMTSSAGVTNERVVVNGTGSSPPWIFQYLSDTASPLAGDADGYLTCRELTQVSVVNVVLYVDKDPNLAVGASTIQTSIFIRSAGFWK